MIIDRREIPDDEAGNPFKTLGEWLRDNISVGTLASAIEDEKSGIYTWDRFGRFGKAGEEDRARALNLLELQHQWASDPMAALSDDPRSPLEQVEGDYDNPFDRFGWAKEVTPDFNKIRQSQNEDVSKPVSKIRRKAPDAFVGAFVRLLVEIAKRDKTINVDEMPGTKSDLLAVAIKFEGLEHSPSTFDSYIEGLCKFKRGSRSGKYYAGLFPEYSK